MCLLVLVAFSSFATAAVVSEKPLTSDVIFPAISLFMLLTFPLAMVSTNPVIALEWLVTLIGLQFSNVTSSIIEALVSVTRLSEFLEADELQMDARKMIKKANLQTGDDVLVIKDGEFSWNKDALRPTLEGIDMTVRKGELVGVLGRVGCGKVS